MNTVWKVETFLTVSGRNLRRNFSFTVINTVGSTRKTASIRIKKHYFLANEIEMNSGDICRITVSVNNKKKVLIFSGSIETVMTTSRDIIIEASYHLFDDKDMNETFKDTSYQDVFLRLTDKLEYRTEDFTPRQIVLKGNKEDNARRLLQSCSHALRRPLYCYLNAQNRLIITDNMGKHKANIFIIDNVLVSVGRVQFVIFPIPEIEIGDRVRLKGKEYRVKAITYDFTMKAFMRLEVL